MRNFGEDLRDGTLLSLLLACVAPVELFDEKTKDYGDDGVLFDDVLSDSDDEAAIEARAAEKATGVRGKRGAILMAKKAYTTSSRAKARKLVEARAGKRGPWTYLRIERFPIARFEEESIRHLENPRRGGSS